MVVQESEVDEPTSKYRGHTENDDGAGCGGI